VLMPGVFWHDMFGYGVAGIGVMHLMLVRLHLVMLVRGRMVRLNTLMHMRGGGRSERLHVARRGVAKRQGCARREHAKQIEQGDEPPRFGAHRPRQANEHGGNLMPSADSAKMQHVVVLILSVIPGRAKHELWCAIAHLRISRFRVHAARAPE
jgi:hypothetical protein